MALKIRLSRTGKKHQASYRVVVCETRSKRDGGFVENIGFYNPQEKPPLVKIERKRLDYWISQGAQPTERIKSLIK